MIKFQTSSSKFLVNGSLDVKGTASSNVYFTSYYDDTVGGDTDGAASTGSTGDWDMIQVNGSATFTHSVIRYGGHNPSTKIADIDLNGGILDIEHFEVAFSNYYCIVQDSGTSTIVDTNFHDVRYGAYFWDGSAAVSSSSFHDNSYYGLYSAAYWASAASATETKAGLLWKAEMSAKHGRLITCRTSFKVM